MSAFADKRISVARPPRMTSLDHALAFCARFGLQFPILLAPMAGVPAPSLSIAVAQAGGMAACGALMPQPNQIVAWADEVRTACNGAFQINLWVPDPPARRDDVHETTVREFLSQWGPKVPPEAGNAALPDFAAQCDALLRARPRAASSVMTEEAARGRARSSASHWAAKSGNAALPASGGTFGPHCERNSRTVVSWTSSRLAGGSGTQRLIWNAPLQAVRTSSAQATIWFGCSINAPHAAIPPACATAMDRNGAGTPAMGASRIGNCNPKRAQNASA